MRRKAGSLFVTQWPKAKAADEDGETGKDGIEDVECAYGADTHEVEQRPFDAQIGEGLMQALEYPVGADFGRVSP